MNQTIHNCHHLTSRGWHFVFFLKTYWFIKFVLRRPQISKSLPYFYLQYIKKKGGDFAKFCGILRIYELYRSWQKRNSEAIIKKDFNGLKKCLRAPDFVIFDSLFDSYWEKQQKSAPNLNSVTLLRWSLPTNFIFSCFMAYFKN